MFKMFSLDVSFTTNGAALSLSTTPVQNFIGCANSKLRYVQHLLLVVAPGTPVYVRT